MTDPRTALAQAESLLRGGQAVACLAACESLLGEFPDLAPARFLAGAAAVHAGRNDRAVDHLASAAAHRPADPHVGFYLGVALRRVGRYAEALDPLQRATRDERHRVTALYERAVCLRRLGDERAAEAGYRTLLDIDQDHADAAAALAALLEARNATGEATTWADRALARRPGHPLASLTRAALERRAGDLDAARARLEALLEADGVTLHNRAIALNLLGRVHDGTGRYEAAWQAFTASNETLARLAPDPAVPSDSPYSLATIARLRRGLDMLPTTGRPVPGDEQLVFLVGFPRSGTTLLDRMLDAHPSLTVLEEHDLLDRTRELMMPDGDPLRLAAAGDELITRARRSYFRARQRILPSAPAPVVVDKLPLNAVHLALIHRLFPGARVIHAVRDPRDACLSAWFQAFDLVGAMPYFLDLATTVHYYHVVNDLLTATLEHLPIAAVRVRYEDIVANYQAALGPVLDHLGLEWDDAITGYRERLAGQRIRTPSYHQVVEPIYQRSVGRWRHYDDLAGTTLAPLEEWVQRWGYAADG